MNELKLTVVMYIAVNISMELSSYLAYGALTIGIHCMRLCIGDDSLPCVQGPCVLIPLEGHKHHCRDCPEQVIASAEETVNLARLPIRGYTICLTDLITE